MINYNKIYSSIFSKKRIISVLRLAVSLTILTIIIKYVDFFEIIKVFININFLYVYLSLLITIIVRFIMAVRWSTLLKSQGVFVPVSHLLKLILITQSISVLIPSSLGVDGARALTLSRQTGRFDNAFSSVIADRYAGVIVLAAIAFVVSVLYSSKFGSIRYIIISGICFFISIIFVFFCIIYRNTIVKIIKKFPFRKKSVIIDKVTDIIIALTMLSTNFRTVFVLIWYTFLAQFLRILFVYFLASALYIDIEFGYYAIFLPLIRLLLMLPISISGIGVQEASLVHFFGPLGMTLEKTLSLSVLLYLDDILWIIVGSIIYFIRGLDLKKKKIIHNN